MRFALVLICIFTTLNADFLGNVYIELKELKLSREQQNQIKNIIRKHHIFLKQWYVDSKENNNQIMESFSKSLLDKDSNEITKGLNLANDRFRADQNFLISVYEILDKKQRELFVKKIRERESINRIPQDRLDDKFQKQEFENNIFGEKDFKKYNLENFDNARKIIFRE
ncbi:hypothetical protein CCY99_05700 [Helicobacter sp. 16-1353]|uniref:hypothetical protein n=1 Tax=Helicobacter sp. 16-1353 TaxID=2004996 RepID=UPI000DCE6FE1|nr:hypothetical protein [Helicobacter sp. 16-1353]RAX53875.1 hypothetical protein CCY99_05700 [Helicobacter sp. 16-1353]